MNPTTTFERQLQSWLEAEAPATGPAGLHEAIIGRARTLHQRPGWLAALRDATLPSPALVIGRLVMPAPRLRFLLVVLGLVLALITVAIAAGAFRPPPFRAPSWVATGSMVTPRTGHTATLLRDGRVLVAGGSLGNPEMGYATFSSAELYDPATRTWAPTGDMATRRYGFTATLLPDGRVLVAGGGDNDTSAELYDPARGTWTATGEMVTPDHGASATLLSDGRVLVAGGGDNAKSAQLYDPASGTWTATGDAIGPHGWSRTAILLPNGKVLLAGGGDANGVVTTSAELYDPASGTWTATGDMVTPRGEPHTATLLPDGTVLVAGGGGGAGSASCCAPSIHGDLPSAELYDPASGTWTATGEMMEVRSYHTATLLPNGKVLVTGSGDGGAVSPELYDPVTRSWTATSNPIEAHLYAETATLLPDGDVLVVGGYNGTESPSVRGVAGAELYDPGIGVAPSESASATPPATKMPVVTPPVVTPSPSRSVIQPGAPRWTAIYTRLARRQDLTFTLLADGKVLVCGGPLYGGRSASAELYDPTTGTSVATGSLVAHAGGGFTATLLRDGKVLVAGGTRDGIIEALEALGSAELYDPASGTWTTTGSMVTPRYGGTATLLADGRVLVVGGGTNSAEVYDPGTGTWTATGSMVTPRYGNTATLLADGRVLVAGGYGTSGETTSAELYDPGTGTWTATGSMARPRLGHAELTAGGFTATLLPDGRVLVVGGDGGSAAALPLTSAEVYDPGTGTWTATGSMITPRFGLHTATLLRDGRVLVAGGSDFQLMPGGEFGRNTSLASAELFDPASGTWTATGDMGTPRQGHTAILLPDGKVLVVGGANVHDRTGESLWSMELYDPGSGN